MAIKLFDIWYMSTKSKLKYLPSELYGFVYEYWWEVGLLEWCTESLWYAWWWYPLKRLAWCSLQRFGIFQDLRIIGIYNAAELLNHISLRIYTVLKNDIDKILTTCMPI